MSDLDELLEARRRTRRLNYFWRVVQVFVVSCLALGAAVVLRRCV